MQLQDFDTGKQFHFKLEFPLAGEEFIGTVLGPSISTVRNRTCSHGSCSELDTKYPSEEYTELLELSCEEKILILRFKDTKLIGIEIPVNEHNIYNESKDRYYLYKNKITIKDTIKDTKIPIKEMSRHGFTIDHGRY
jgi:hypothetical protein